MALIMKDILGSDDLSIGEIVFNTAMTGYQETISDPSYTGQIITFTYPLIGNYGINRDDFESLTPTLNGVVVKEASTHPSNFRHQKHYTKYLFNIIFQVFLAWIQEVSHVRFAKHGVLRAGFTDNKDDIQAIVEH